MGGLSIKKTDDVQMYSIEKNAWSALPALLKAMSGSAAVLLGVEHIYNIDGKDAAFSVLCSNLGSLSSKWRAVEVKEA